MSIKAILFDLDGTLIDSESYYVNGTVEWLSKLGINISFEDATRIIGKDMDETYNIIHELSGLDINTIIKKNTDYFENENKLDFNKVLLIDVIPCFKDLINQGYKICICSMSPKSYVKTFIDVCGLNNYVDDYIGGEDCIRLKPDPEIYNKMISKLNLNKKEVLVVEDAPSGLKAGKDSGAYVVGRNSAKFGFNQSDALCLFEDLKELNTIIKEINNGKYD